MNTSSSISNRVPMTLRDFFFQDPFFQSSWSDFDRIREEMMKETRAFWEKVEQDQKAMQSGMMIQDAGAPTTNSTITTSSSTGLSGTKPTSITDMAPFSPMIVPRRWMFPRLFSRDDSEALFPSDFFNWKNDDQMIRQTNDETKFELSLDTHDYRPDEIKVNVNGNILSVEAKHEEKGENKFVSRQFSRKYTLPEGCEAHKVHSNLSSDGILMITAPKKTAITQDGSRPVPIEVKK